MHCDATDNTALILLHLSTYLIFMLLYIYVLNLVEIALILLGAFYYTLVCVSHFNGAKHLG